MIRFLALIPIACLFGCSLPTEHTSTLDQRQRENVAQRATSDFARSLEPLPTEVTIKAKDGSTTTIKQPTPEKTRATATAEENSNSEATGASLNSVTIPLFVKIIGIALGIGLLAAVIGGIIWYLRKSSAAVNAAWNWTDEAISNKLATIRALKGASTDPARIQALTESEAHLESLRADANK